MTRKSPQAEQRWVVLVCVVVVNKMRRRGNYDDEINFGFTSIQFAMFKRNDIMIMPFNYYN